MLDRAKGGERIELFVEAGANSAFGKFNRRIMHEPRISVFNQEVWECFWDMRTLADLLNALESDSPRRAQILHVLNKVVDQFDYCGEPSREELRVQARFARQMLGNLLNRKAEPSAITMACMGHAHIDVAWLWPLSETIRKCGRTFSNALALMQYYPEYKFVQSQPQLYEITRQRYPALYKRIKEMVRKNNGFLRDVCGLKQTAIYQEGKASSDNLFLECGL